MRRRWAKRITSIMLAVAMVVAGIGPWSWGLEAVKAEESWQETAYVVNGGFEEDETGWTVNIPKDSNNWNYGYGIQGEDNSDGKALGIWENKSSGPVTVSLSQSVTLPAGTYKLAISTTGKAGSAGLIAKLGDKASITLEDSDWGTWKNKESDSFVLNEETTLQFSLEGTIPAGIKGSAYDNIRILARQDFSETAYLVNGGFEEDETGWTVNIPKDSNNWNYGYGIQGEDNSDGKALGIWENKSSGPVTVSLSQSVTLPAGTYKLAISTTGKAGSAGLIAKLGDKASITLEDSDWGTWKNKESDSFVLNEETTLQFALEGTIPAGTKGSAYDNIKILSAGAQGGSGTPAEPEVVNGDLNITKVPNLAEDFIMGMDISSVISEFESGVIYRKYDGTQLTNVTDFCSFLAENGITHIRVRVWNDPTDAGGNSYGGGHNDVATAKKIADACRSAGLKMLVDFHCSDLWTDPGKFQAPKAWKTYSVSQKEAALKAFIKDSLNTIDPSKDVVAMVQVGNETTGGFVGEKNETDMCTLFKAGAAGVREYNAAVKVVIHVTNPEKSKMTSWAKTLDANSVDYDILATSYYPYWHGTLTNLKSQFTTVKNTYGKDVMVAETSYAYTLEDTDGHTNTVRVGKDDSGADTTEPFTEQGQATSIRNLIHAVNSVGGLGVFYWEPAWITVGDTTGLTGDAYTAKVEANKTIWETKGSGWASSYAGSYSADEGQWYGGSAVDNEAMFYPDGTATPGLRVWKYVRTGSTTTQVSVEEIGGSDGLSQEILAGQNYTALPKQMTVRYNCGEVQENIEWNADDIAKIDTSKAGTYTIRGTIQFSKTVTQGIAYRGKSGAEITYRMIVKKKNLITNEKDAGIESGTNFTHDNGSWITKDKFPSTKDVISGTYCMHWTSATALSDKTLTYNKVITLEPGSYTFEAVAHGAAGDKVTLQILDENDKLVIAGQPAVMNGWQNYRHRLYPSH